jgi:hypothetical protein
VDSSTEEASENSKKNDFGTSVEGILRAELKEIDSSRSKRLGSPQESSIVKQETSPSLEVSPESDIEGKSGLADIHRKALDRKLIGLAFSGGGIRSATFNLGVLQALSQLGLLRFIDYLSTVSGGGYIGSWLIAWTRRKQSIQEVEGKLGNSGRTGMGSEELPAVSFLRKYSNYLTPKVGLFSTDSWAIASTYLRNLSLNMLVLLLAVSIAICLPLLFVWLLKSVNTSHESLRYGLFAAFLGFLGTAILFIIMNLASGTPSAPKDPWYTRRPFVLFVIVLPVILSSVIGSFWFWSYRKVIMPNKWMYILAVLIVYFVAWCMGQLLSKGSSVANAFSQPKQSWMRNLALAAGEKLKATVTDIRLLPRFKAGVYLYASGISLAAGGLLISGLSHTFLLFGDGESAEWYVAIFGVPLLILFYMAIVTAQIGIMGREMADESREWWSRLGGWVLIFLTVWAALFGLVMFGLPAVAWIGKSGAAAAALGWLTSSVAGLLAGKSSSTGGKGSNKYLEIAAQAAPYVFVVGLTLVTSSVLCAVIISLSSLSAAWGNIWGMLQHQEPSFSELTSANIYLMGGIFGDAYELSSEVAIPSFAFFVFACLLGAVILSWRFDINQFSIHLLYRNRLVRCYLGATNEQRHPQPITGFDPRDDIPLNSLLREAQEGGYVGPYPIINTTINLVGGKKLAWQQRKAASFVLTPKFCGYDLSLVASRGPKAGGYRQTNEYGGGQGMPIGEAMAISGAAASPNMGYHSSAPLAFLMTVFNVRLGWWCGNTRYEKAWKKSSPHWSLGYLLMELFGMTNDMSRYVYLSDGGHFENLGLYELVRRRCRLVIVSDASCDPEMKFDDLGNAIRKIRIDFGITIDIELSPLKEKNKRCAMGTINYKGVDGDSVENGTLIYLKPAICGNEPADVANYKARHDTFPHQGTADQWFDESQFESYRMLGLHSVLAILDGKWNGKTPFDLIPFIDDYLKRPELVQQKKTEAGH